MYVIQCKTETVVNVNVNVKIYVVSGKSEL